MVGAPFRSHEEDLGVAQERSLNRNLPRYFGINNCFFFFTTSFALLLLLLLIIIINK